MAKKKQEKLNLKNPKQLMVVHCFALAEGRLSKEKIIEQGNKEIFYHMKNGGYIKEAIKGSGVYKATGKLQTLTRNKEGITFGNGCSNKHSEKIYKAVSYLPENIIKELRFECGQSLKKEMMDYKDKKSYITQITNLQKQILREERQLYNEYEHQMKADISYGEKMQVWIDTKEKLSSCSMRKEIAFSDTPVFIPDFKVTATKTEIEEILVSLSKRNMEVVQGSKEQCFMEQNIEKLKQMINLEQEQYEIYFEVITDSYGKRELELHQNYETVMKREVLYIY